MECSQRELDKGGIIVGLTQQSLIDPTIGYAAFDRQFMAIWNVEYALIPVLGWISWVLGWVIIRQSPRHSKLQPGKAAEYAAKGGLVYLSIEGQRSLDGKLNPYKKGPAVLALQSQSQIIPFYLRGSRACLPHGHWKIRPGTVEIRILKPIAVNNMQYDDRNALIDELRRLDEKENAQEVF